MPIRVTSYRPEPAAPEPVEFTYGPLPPKPEPAPDPEPDPRRDWSDLLAAWLVVYDRTQPWRLRRRREARERIRHWMSLLDPPQRRKRPPADHALLLSVALWITILAVALIGGSR